MRMNSNTYTHTHTKRKRIIANETKYRNGAHNERKNKVANDQNAFHPAQL